MDRRKVGLSLIVLSLISALLFFGLETMKANDLKDLKGNYTKGNYVKFTANNLELLGRTLRVTNENYDFDQLKDKEEIYLIYDSGNEKVIIEARGDLGNNLIKRTEDYYENGRMEPVEIKGKVVKQPDKVYKLYQDYRKEVRLDEEPQNEAKMITTDNKGNFVPSIASLVVALFGLRMLLSTLGANKRVR